MVVIFEGREKKSVPFPRYSARRTMTQRFEFLNSTEKDSIGGCLDYQLQRTVPLGSYYSTESCEICLCSATEKRCKQVACAPPETCSGYFKRDPKHCCDICVLVEQSPDSSRENLNLKLGVVTVAAFLLLTLILFAVHRFRKKRLLLSLRSFQMLRRSSSGSCGVDGVTSVDGRTLTELTESVAGVTLTPDGGVRLNGYSFPEAPPPYTPAAVSRTPSVSPRRGVESAEVVAEPPPPYPTSTMEQVRGFDRQFSGGLADCVSGPRRS